MTNPDLLGDVRAHQNRGIFQNSTVGALLAGLDDGDLTIGGLLEHGDFGLGTFDALDGEMVILDGVCYHLHADGTASVAGVDETTPFAAVTDFTPEITLTPTGLIDRAGLVDLVEKHVPGDNYFYAVRVDAELSTVTTRTVSRQEKPYPGLVKASEGEAMRTLTDLRGTIVGFRSPDYAGTVTVPGYHLHFIDDTRKRGGHLLDFELAEGGKVTISSVRDFRLRLPGTDGFAAGALTGERARSQIAAAEGGS